MYGNFDEDEENLLEALKGSDYRRLRKRDDEEERKKTNLTDQEEYKEYAKTVFARSYIASFADVAESTSYKKQAFVLGVFFFSVFGLIYQATDFTDFYLTYPTLRSELYMNPFYVELPAITICNANKYKRSIYCRKPWIEVTEYENTTEFCAKFPTFCPDSGRPFKEICEPKKGERNLKAKGVDIWKQAKELGHTTSMIVSCIEHFETGDRPCRQPYHEMPAVSSLNQDLEATYCFSINSASGDPDVKPEQIGRTDSIDLVIAVEPDEYQDVTVSPSIYVGIHDRKMEENPFNRGRRLYAGSKIFAQIKDITENTLQPAPYDTNCTDYIKMWKENGGYGPLTVLECVEECIIKFLLERNRCIPYAITFTHHAPLCDDDSQDDMSALVMESNCSKGCNNPCFFRSYGVTYVEDSPTWCEYYPENPSAWCSKAFINLTVSFNKFRVIRTSNNPRMHDIEFFSNVGGYLGMWIGISLVDGIDFLACVYLVLYFPILRKKFKEAQRKKRLARQQAAEKKATSDVFNTNFGIGNKVEPFPIPE